MSTMHRVIQRARSHFAAPPPEAGPIDGMVPPDIRLGPELTRLKLEEGRAVANGDLDRARAIRAQRVRLHEQLQNELS